MIRFIKRHKYLLIFLTSIVIVLMGSSCRNEKGQSETHAIADDEPLYTCSMHPQIVRDKPGKCPVCGMELVKKPMDTKKITDTPLEDLLKPANEFVISSVPVTTIKKSSVELTIEATGNIQNDSREFAAISAKATGRIEKLYVRYRYQMVMPGDKIMDIYSPEIATAQQNLLFLLKSDAANTPLIEAAKQRLLLQGMSNGQLQQLVRTRKASFTVSVYSNAMGHIHEAGQETMGAEGQMQATSATTLPLAVKEGMYVQLGQKIFSLTNPEKAWAILNIFPEDQRLVKVGSPVRIVPEAMPAKAFNATINFIEPFYRPGSKTITARVYFRNAALHIPIGSQLRATISARIANANWLPEEAVLSAGLNQIVLVKSDGGFIAKRVQTGTRHNNLVQIISGLAVTDTVASNAQYLFDSESLIKIKQ